MHGNASDNQTIGHREAVRADTAPPTRYDNPFATCWTRPGAQRFRFPAGNGAGHLVQQLESNRWRGQIVGAHGSGKTTLLSTMLPELQRAGCAVRSLELRNGQRSLPHGLPVPLASSPRPAVIVVDGFEQLRWWQRLRLHWFCMRHDLGLLVTAHRSVGLPTIARLVPTPHLVQELVDGLTGNCITRGGRTSISRAAVVASFAKHNGNVREIFFDLYDRYECHARNERTRGGVHA